MALQEQVTNRSILVRSAASPSALNTPSSVGGASGIGTILTIFDRFVQAAANKRFQPTPTPNLLGSPVRYNRRAGPRG